MKINYHKSIDTLSYWNFLQVRKHNDLRYLFELPSYLNLSKANPGPEHLKAFEYIMEEYNDVILKREKASMLFEFEKEIGELQAEYHLCKLCLNQITIFEDEEKYKDVVQKYINELSNRGKSYKGNLEATEGQIDSILNEIDELVIARNRLSGKSDDATAEQMIDALEKHRGGHQIDITKTTVRQFLTYETSFIEEIARRNKKDK